jgi:hypothetical protein
VSNAIDIQVAGNQIQYGQINVDAGQGNSGIGFYGATNSSAENNIITLEAPSTNATQTGITAAIWGTALIANNTILNPANYGIDFGDWGLDGGNNITITKNTIQNYGNFGIYDNNNYIDQVNIEQNTISSNKATATYAIFIQNPANKWTLNGNTF